MYINMPILDQREGFKFLISLNSFISKFSDLSFSQVSTLLCVVEFSLNYLYYIFNGI